MNTDDGHVWKTVRILGLVAALIFGAWELDKHYVTRDEFTTLRQDVKAIRDALGVGRPVP